MRIDKTTEPRLFSLYEEFTAFKKNDTQAYRQWRIEQVVKKNDISFEVNEYCRNLGVETNDKEERQKAYLDFYARIDKKIFGERFNVEYVSEPFLKGVEDNVVKLLLSVKEESYYESLGECSGFLIIKDFVVEYAILEDGAYFIAEGRNTEDGGQQSFFGKSTLNNIGKWDALNVVEQTICLAVATLILKKYGEVETVLVAAGARRKLPEKNEVIMNKAPFSVTQLDSSWLRTIIRTEGFMVRGHFRLQPYGTGRSERKLIYIEPYEKHGYTRTAKKLLSEE